MTKSDPDLRVVIALTDTDSIAELWHAAMKTVSGARAEMLAVFVHDERWERAARLPFTREVSRVGSVSDFTAKRANQVLAETVSSLQQRIETLAADADLSIEFRVLPESDSTLTQEIVGPGKSVLIAPAMLARQPIYAQLSQLDVRIELVEAGGNVRDEDDADAGNDEAES